jgi:hypothetical protein
MEAAMVEMSASEPRERLLAFVGEVVRSLPHVRQRQNALLYVRGLIEHGGRKSLQPTLFRLEESPARYESMQQFLADSPWQPDLLVRACARCSRRTELAVDGLVSQLRREPLGQVAGTSIARLGPPRG